MKIAVFGQYYQSNTAEIAIKVVDFLKRNDINILFEATFLKILTEKEIVLDAFETYSSYEELPLDTEALISIGGDGTILKAATFIRDKNIPIIAQTAFAMHGDDAKYIAAGFDAYISKPFTKNELLSKIKELI